MTGRVIDGFAGAGGWDRAAESLGLRPIGIELDEWACKTRAATGLLTIRADITTLTPASFGEVEGLIMSPPCPDFSVAGRRAGIEGETGRLMYEVPRWVRALRPRWVACEQVPPALPWWRSFALDLAALDYRAWCGLLTSADFGTPQNRQRAFLLLHRDRYPFPPAATHAEDPHPNLVGFTPKPWVPLAEGLGRAPSVTGKAGGQWVYERPATTVSATPRIAKPGHHERQWEGSIQVTLPELGVLQDFPADHPWQGNKTQQSTQIGNCVPVRLARAVLAATATFTSARTATDRAERRTSPGGEREGASDG